MLLLAGTLEARVLAERLAADARFAVTASLAGVVRTPGALPVPTRIGNFGGVAGLRTYLAREAIDTVIDATHPFATRISANAAQACNDASIPLLRLERAAWEKADGDIWHEVATLAQAARALPMGARAFLTVGRQDLACFAGRDDLWCLMRTIDPPAIDARLPRGDIVLSKPLADIDAELDLFRRYALTHLVTKNSGGTAARAKLEAARHLALPVIMVARPHHAVEDGVTSIEAAVRWLEHLATQLCRMRFRFPSKP